MSAADVLALIAAFLLGGAATVWILGITYVARHRGAGVEDGRR